MSAFRNASFLLACVCVLSTSGGCYTAGQRPSPAGFIQTALEANSETLGLPLVDPDFRLAPNDLLGITYISKDTPGGYLLQTGDTLLVEYHQQEHLNRNIVVRPDGMVTLPYIGDVQASYGTVDGLAKKIADLYRKEEVFDNLTTTVSLLSFNTKLRELQAINNNSNAGQTREAAIGGDGYLDLPLGIRIDAAGKTMADLRRDIREVYDGALPGVEVHTELRAMRANFIYVLGEVNQPGLCTIAGPTGVAQAVAAAGGFRNTADLKSVVVLRANPECDAPLGRLVDVERIISEGDLSGDLMIRRFDVVYVPPSKIKKLNDAVLMYIRNMMPIETHGNVGFSYMWGDTNGGAFKPF
ncbi:MAG: polysaccharide biosynthesis/export family protein [Planctomycetota bacterium]|jgi:polysaccharide export outer membrane protein|nr:polysaccharide biosynthesis/export family protein [Planctomycetota bacterium]